MILIVEDTVPIGKHFESELREQGHDVVWTADPHHALALCKEHSVERALLDVNLGVPMDGIELAFELRKLSDTMRLVIFTGHMSHTEYQIGMTYGSICEELQAKYHCKVDDSEDVIQSLMS